MEARNEFRYARSRAGPLRRCSSSRGYYRRCSICGTSIFFKDVETHYYWQLQFAKYRIENIAEDLPHRSDDLRPSVFRQRHPAQRNGGEVGWMDDGPPRAVPVIHSVEQMERVRGGQARHGLAWARPIDWWLK